MPLPKKITVTISLLIWALVIFSSNALALSTERWTTGDFYGIFFNTYDPNFYTGFAPRVQEKERITIHVARGNQMRIQMVLSDKTIMNYLADQVARHALYQEVINKKIITLTTNMAWEKYHQRVEKEKLDQLVANHRDYSDDQWKELNLKYMEKLIPGRLHHIQKDFNQMTEDFFQKLTKRTPADSLAVKLETINSFFPHRILLTDISKERDAVFSKLNALAKSGDMVAFRRQAQAFFNDITQNIYLINNGRLDFYEFTTIYPVGTYDATTTYRGMTIPKITTTGVWWLTPRMSGSGITGMIDYISPRGYYGVMPWIPYQHAGGRLYNAFHNPGISNWISGHRLLPEQWKNVTMGSRTGKPFLRVSVTSRGPVSHGCTRLNSGHLAEFREMLPSTSSDMEHIMVYRSLSPDYDVFDLEGDGNDKVMGVQYYIAFRHNKSRVAKQIWAQNNRKNFYKWLYGNEIKYAPIGEITFAEAYEGTFIHRKAVRGRRYENIGLYEAPYEPEYLQFYVIKGMNKFSSKAVKFNTEMRRVGYGYQLDRKKLLLEE